MARRRTAPLEYFIDLFVGGRLEDGSSKRHDPRGGSPRQQAARHARRACAEQARYGGGTSPDFVISRLDVQDGDLKPMYAVACCIRRGADGERAAMPHSVKPPKELGMRWAPPKSTCRR